MNIEREPVEESTIEDFAIKHNLTMKVSEREDPGDPGMKFYARFFFGDYSVDVVDRIFLKGEHGNGRTEQEAIKHYTELLSLKTLCLVRGDARKDIKCPRFIPSAPKALQAPATVLAKGAAKRVSDAVMHHIDVMYPAVSEIMHQSARKSIGNFIMMEVEVEVEAVVNPKAEDHRTLIIEAAQRVTENYFLGTNNTKRNHADDFRALESLLRNASRP